MKDKHGNARARAAIRWVFAQRAAARDYAHGLALILLWLALVAFMARADSSMGFGPEVFLFKP